MTDRELLEAAARAAGKNLISGHPDDPRGVFTTLGWWNPLTDDGDALRLACKLNLRVDCYDDQVETMDGCEPYKIGRETFTNNFVTIEPLQPGDDKMAAVRRSIVRAAAAMAKSTP